MFFSFFAKSYATLFYFVLVFIAPILHSVLHLSQRENEVFFDVVVIVDPLTREAQKISQLLIVSEIISFAINTLEPF